MIGVISIFKGYLTERDRAEHTVNGYSKDLELFSRWFEQTNGEELGENNLTPTDVRLYRQFLQEKAKAKPATINRRLAALRMFGESLQALGLSPSNPAAGVRGIREQTLSPKWLDKKEQAALTRTLERCQAAATTEAGKRQAVRDRAAVLLMLNTGLRVSEVCSLEMADLEFSERKGKVTVRLGKGGKARCIPLNQGARDALKAWYELRGDEAGRVFLGKRGDYLTPSGLQRRLEEIGRLAKVDVTPHGLRHTFAKNLIDAGVTLEKVALLLGHSSLNTTRIYTVPSHLDLVTAVGMLDF